MRHFSWRLAVLAAVVLAVVMVGVGELVDHTGIGGDDPVGAGLSAFFLIGVLTWLAAAVVAAVTGPRWAEWAVAVAIVILVEEVWTDGVHGADGFAARVHDVAQTAAFLGAGWYLAVIVGLGTGFVFYGLHRPPPIR